jgi:SAM-dependent methyltransferase
MLRVARDLASTRAISNVIFGLADAEQLPFDAGRFDLVTCRIAPHHFPRIDCFMAESVRVLRLGGILAVVDNVVPGSRLSGTEANKVREAGDYVNAFEKLRDPSHCRALSLVEWEDHFLHTGVVVLHQEILRKEIEFDPWVERMNVSPANKTRLQAMLTQAPAMVAEFLTPSVSGNAAVFFLTEAILIGKTGSG